MKTRTWQRTLTAAAVILAAAAGAMADDEAPRSPGAFENIHIIDFEGNIEALMFAYTKRRLEAAEKDGADCVILRIHSPGGTVYHSKEIGDALLDMPDSMHTIAWIPKEALSGAAFVSLACKEIVMAPGAVLGDAQPILGGPGGGPIESAGEKIESPLRAWFTAYARKNGYPILLAQAMVSSRMEVIRVRPKGGGDTFFMEGDEYRRAEDDAELFPGLTKKDLQQVGTTLVGAEELLTMTAEEALDYGFIARRHEGGLYPDEDALLEALKAPGATVHQTEMSFSENASKWLLAVAGVLSAIVAMAVLVFMWQGPGLMTIVGGVALVLIVLISLTAEQLNGFPIFLILLGIGLLAVEVFLFPGFGLPGIAGIVSMATGFLFLATGSTLDNTQGIDSEALKSFGLQFVFTAIVVMGIMLSLSRFIPRVGPARRMILEASGQATVGALVEGSPAPVLGAVGRAQSALRPAGSADFGGVLTDVVSDGGFIPAQTDVQVVSVEGDRVTVRAVAHEGGGTQGGSAKA